MEKRNPIEEARRHISDANEILKERAIRDGDYYTDSKYIKIAGHTLWTGCLIALDYALNIKKPKKGRLDIKDYQMAASRKGKKLTTLLTSGYNVMHLSMSYDGEKSYVIVKIGTETANKIVDWYEAKTNK